MCSPGIGVEWVLIFAIVTLPPLQTIFFTAPLAPHQWLLLLLCPPLVLGVEEGRKALFRWMDANPSVPPPLRPQT